MFDKLITYIDRFRYLKNKKKYHNIYPSTNTIYGKCKYRVMFSFKGKRHYVGGFLRLKDAVIARDKFMEYKNGRNKKS